MTTPRTYRASAALPASGAYDLAPATIEMGTSSRVRLFCKYTRGAAGGAFKLKVARSDDGGTTFIDDTVIDGTSLSSGALNVFTLELKFPVAAGAPQESRNFLIEAEIETLVRVAFAEYGNTGSPGTLEVTMVVR
jgi:hypothetical protein